MSKNTNSPDLEDRFLAPKGWRWHTFKNMQGKSLRFGSVFPESRVPDAVIIFLEGLGDFCEKYFELANNLVDQNLALWIMDWQGQGKSERFLKNPQKRHSAGFDQDVADLHFFIQEYVKHSAVHPDVGRIPLVMLGQGMGANIGIRYLHNHPDTFACAAFLSPMCGIKSLRIMPKWVSLAYTAALQEILDTAYIEFGGKDWSPADRSKYGKDLYSSDELRDSIHRSWLMCDEDLKVGNITYRWLHEANLSCLKIQKEDFLKEIKTPVMFVLGKNDKISDMKAIKKVANALPNNTIIEIPDAKNEIVMETDEIRNQFLNSFANLLQENKISEQLKPF